MTNEQFINILSLQMVQVKMSMQILATLLPKETYKKWENSFENIEKEFSDIIEQLKGNKK